MANTPAETSALVDTNRGGHRAIMLPVLQQPSGAGRTGGQDHRFHVVSGQTERIHQTAATAARVQVAGRYERGQ